MKTQKLQLALIHKKRSNQKLIKKPSTVIIRAIFRSTKFFVYYVLFINNWTDTRLTSFSLKRSKTKTKKMRKREREGERDGERERDRKRERGRERNNKRERRN